MGQQLEPDKAQKLRTGYFLNLRNNQNAAQAGCSVGTAFNHTKKLEDEIQKYGLMPTLNKYGLTEARNIAILGQSLIIHQTTPEECFVVIPFARKLAAGHIPIESMEIVVDQVFAVCPPDRAREFGAAMLEYANERQQNENLSIVQVRGRYHDLTARYEKLSERERVLAPAVAQLESQHTQLRSNINSLSADQKRLSDQLAEERQTNETLRQYIFDKAYLREKINVDIMNVPRAVVFFQEMERLGYNASRVATLITNNPLLSRVAAALEQEITDLTKKKTQLDDEIPILEEKRLEALRRAAEAEKEADARIAASQKRVEDQLAREKTTLAEIEDSKKFRAELKEAGLD